MEQNENNNAESVKTNSGSVGPVVGTIIILLVILVGALYFWENIQEKKMQNNEEVQMEGSDEVSDIEADLEATAEFEDLDADLEAMEKEFDNI